MVRAFISIGSNVQPEENVRTALGALARHFAAVKISTVYRTRAEERPEQPDFYNCVAEIETELSPHDLKFGVLRRIEEAQGRERTSDKNAPRTIDLDLILYGDVCLNSGELVLPDPDIFRRAFLAIPLSELDPSLVIPGTGFHISGLAESFHENTMQPLPEYTASLREC